MKIENLLILLLVSIFLASLILKPKSYLRGIIQVKNNLNAKVSHVGDIMLMFCVLFVIAFAVGLLKDAVVVLFNIPHGAL